MNTKKRVYLTNFKKSVFFIPKKNIFFNKLVIIVQLKRFNAFNKQKNTEVLKMYNTNTAIKIVKKELKKIKAIGLYNTLTLIEKMEFNEGFYKDFISKIQLDFEEHYTSYILDLAIKNWENNDLIEECKELIYKHLNVIFSEVYEMNETHFEEIDAYVASKLDAYKEDYEYASLKYNNFKSYATTEIVALVLIKFLKYENDIYKIEDKDENIEEELYNFIDVFDNSIRKLESILKEQENKEIDLLKEKCEEYSLKEEEKEAILKELKECDFSIKDTFYYTSNTFLDKFFNDIIAESNLDFETIFNKNIDDLLDDIMLKKIEEVKDEYKEEN